MASDSEQRTYLRAVMDKTGWTQSQLAHRAGLDPSTLSRFLSAERPGHALRSSTMLKIAAASGMEFGSDSRSAPAAGFAEAEAAPLLVPARHSLRAVIDGLAAGRANIDPWTLHSRALENAGYRPGDILLVALDEAPQPGDLICAQVYEWAKGETQTVFRLFQPPYLLTASSEVRFMHPLKIDDPNVAIKGVVMASIRGRAVD